jgi:hypothetical protein
MRIVLVCALVVLLALIAMRELQVLSVLAASGRATGGTSTLVLVAGAGAP